MKMFIVLFALVACAMAAPQFGASGSAANAAASSQTFNAGKHNNWLGIGWGPFMCNIYQVYVINMQSLCFKVDSGVDWVGARQMLVRSFADVVCHIEKWSDLKENFLLNSCIQPNF